MVATPTAAAIYVANLCLNTDSPTKTARPRNAMRASIPHAKEGLVGETPLESPSPHSKRRYDVILFLLFLGAIGSVALLAYALLSNV